MSDQGEKPTIAMPKAELEQQAQESQNRLVDQAKTLLSHINQLTDASTTTAKLKQEANAAFNEIHNVDIPAYRAFVRTYESRYKEAMNMTSPSIDIRALLAQQKDKKE